MVPEDKRPVAAPFADAPAFIHDIAWNDLPAPVVRHARRCLLDLIGCAAAGIRTNASQIARAHATAQMRAAAGEARMLFDGRRASPAGAAFAGAATLDSFDAHDGHVLVKGHVGAVALPALLAFLDAGAACSEREFLTTLVMAYEVGTRAGIALHTSVPEAHTSGAWNTIAAAAVGARLLGFGREQIRHALAIAEYNGPRGQLLRAVRTPAMTKDGSSWGAYTGVTGALLAQGGFSGAPAITVEDPALAHLWGDLGTRWRILEQYFKAYPVCRYAQPAIEAGLALQRAHGFTDGDIAGIEIHTFAEAVALGSAQGVPKASDEAQYSLPYPLAAALVFGDVGAEEIEFPKMADPRVLRLLGLIRAVEDREFSRRFPAERWARVRIVLNDGRAFDSEPAIARGNPENPLSDDEIRQKYRKFAMPVLGAERTARIEALVDGMGAGGAAPIVLVDAVLQAPPKA